MKEFKTCMKGLIRMSAPMKSPIFLSVVLGAARIAASLFYVWICKRLIDVATGNADGELLLYVALMFTVMLIQLLLGTASQWWEGKIVTRNQNETRAKVFSHVLRSEWNGREGFHSGDMVNRLEEDIRVVTDLVCTRIPNVIITLTQLTAACIFLFALSPSLMWVLLILMPVAIVGSRMFFKTIRALTAHIRARDSEVQGYMQENLQCRILVKTLGSAEKVMEKKYWLQTDVMDHTIKRLNYNAIARGFMRLGFMAGYAAAFLWGVFGIKDGSVTYGMMTAFLQLVSQIQNPMVNLSHHIPAFIHGLTSIERIMELEELPLEDDGPEVLLDGAPGIRVDNISFRYEDAADIGRDAVFKNFSYDFRPGSVTSVVGETGAGKSSLFRIILGLLKPSEGSVSLYTEDGRSLPAGASARCNFLYVPQGNSLMSGTIRDNLLFANPSATEQQMKAALHTAVADFVFELPQGLDTVCSEKGSGLSEGQAQRIAIARALLHTGGILILDEATSALDVQTEKILLERISSALRGTKTIIWITHREAIAGISDNVLRIG